MKSILMLLGILAIPVQAGKLIPEHDGDMLLAIPTDFSLKLTRNESGALNYCPEVMEKLNKNRGAILKCSDDAEAPKTFCQLLGEDLKRTLQKAEVRSKPLQERWTVATIAVPPTPGEFHAFVNEHGVVTEQAVLVTPLSFNLSQGRLEGAEGSFTDLLSKASILELHPQYEFQTEHQNTSLKLMDRLSACELESGKMLLRSTLSVDYRYTVAKDPEQRRALWEVRMKLLDVSQRSFNPRQKYVLAGFHLADHLISTGQSTTTEAVLGLSALLLKEEAQNFVLKDYRNEFHLGQFLPQVSHALSKQFELVGGAQ